MRPKVWIAGVLLTALIFANSCSVDPSEQAKREYRDIAKSSTASDVDRCNAARRVQQAYQEAGNQTEYQRWYVTAAIDCRRTDRTH